MSVDPLTHSVIGRTVGPYRSRPLMRGLKLCGGLLAIAVLIALTGPSQAQQRETLPRIAVSMEVDRGEGVTDTDIFLIHLDGGRVENLFDRAFGQSNPAWAPDGRQLAFSSNGEIRVVTRTGSNERRVVRPAYGESANWFHFFPSWSPDGRKLVYASSERANDGSYVSSTLNVTSVAGKGREEIVATNDVIHMPSWSPDGNTIAFFQCRRPPVLSRDLGDSCSLHTVKADGSDATTLTPAGARSWETYPAWTADGRIIFTSRRSCAPVNTQGDRCQGLYRSRRDGSGTELLTLSADWTGDGAVDRIIRAEPGPVPSEMLVMIYASGMGRQLWMWDMESDRKYQVLDARFIPEADFDSEPVCDELGTRGDDVLVGSAGRDLICGLGGDDVIKGLGGDDVIFGHAGRDRIVGGAGRDIVVGNEGRDRCDRDERDYSRVC